MLRSIDNCLKLFRLAGCMLAILSALLPSICRSQETELKRARTPIDMEIMSDFISFDLSATQPKSSIKAEGGPTRTVHGTLLDHNGEPVAGAFVAFASRIGYGDRNYFENFDVTDARGRFVVEADEERERLVFHRGEGIIWPVQLEDNDRPVIVRWPAPARLHVRIAPELCAADSELALRTTHYWAGMNSNSVQGRASGHNATFENLVPGAYNLYAISPGNRRSQTLIGTIRIGEGESLELGFDTADRRRVTFELDVPEGSFCHIHEVQTQYSQVTGAVDAPVLENGRWTSSLLIPGKSYELLIDIPEQPVEGVEQMFIWPNQKAIRFHLPPGDGDFEINSEGQAESITGRLSEIIDNVALDISWSQADVQAVALKTLAEEDPEALTAMCELINSEETPFSWRPVILQALGSMTERNEVIDALLKLLPVAEPEIQSYVLVALHKVPADSVERVIDEIAKVSNSSNRYVRRSALLAFANTGVNNRQTVDKIIPFLIAGLSDPSLETRWIAATNLGSFKAEAALPELERVQNSDPSGKVRVYAARAIWQISGDTEVLIRTMTERLFADDMGGKAMAARFLGELVAGEEAVALPELTLKGLEKAAEFVPEPPVAADSYRVREVREAGRRTLEIISERDGGNS